MIWVIMYSTYGGDYSYPVCAYPTKELAQEHLDTCNKIIEEKRAFYQHLGHYFAYGIKIFEELPEQLLYNHDYEEIF